VGYRQGRFHLRMAPEVVSKRVQDASAIVIALVGELA
jgi:hypothetical protein